MCTPELAAAAAMEGGGAVLNGRQQNKQLKRTAHASNRAAKRELGRQHGFQEQATGVLDNATGGVAGPGAVRNLAEGQVRRENALSGAVTDPGTVGSIPGSAPPVVQSEISRKMADAVSGAKANATRLGALGGYDDVSAGNAIKLGRAGQDIGSISSAAGGSASLLPLEQQAVVNNSYRAPNGFGDLLQLGGKALNLYGLTRTPSLPAMKPRGPERFGDLF